MCKQEVPEKYEEIQHFIPLYTRTFPWKSHVQITACENISTGWEGDILSLSLAYDEEHRHKTEEVILKLYHGEDGVRKARSEFYSLQVLTSAHYPVPRALFAALEASPFGRAAVSMEKIQGETIAHIFEQSEQAYQQVLITQCSQLYVDLHALNWEALVPDLAPYQEKDVIQSWFAWASNISDQWLPGVFDPVLAWLQERRGEITRPRLAVLHGDFHLDNLLMREDGSACVIDWTGTKISDYRFDLSWTLLLQRTQGQTELADAMLKEYERLAGHRVEQLDFFEVIACFKRLFEITVSLKNGATMLGMKPDAEGEMKQQLDRIQAVYAQLQQRIVHPLPQIEDLIDTLSCHAV